LQVAEVDDGTRVVCQDLLHVRACAMQEPPKQM
jgi:hypothetical protein